MSTTKIFYDSEFTGLHQKTTLISIGLVSECGQQFYAEFSDYDKSQCDDWINENVLKHTRWLKNPATAFTAHQENNAVFCYGDTAFIRTELENWLAEFDDIEIWADCLAYDWVLFCQIFGGAFNIPQQIFYMPMDLATLFKIKGLNPDCSRTEFAGINALTLHNALDDALLVKACYEKLRRIS